MTSQTPIFDQLVDEFNKSGVYEFGFVYEGKSRLTPKDDGMNFLVNLGEVLAQDEEEDATTVVMEAVPAALKYGVSYSDEMIRRNVQTAVEMHEGAGTSKTLYDATRLAVIKPVIPEMVKMPRQSVADVLKEADEELGLNDVDKAFEEADRVLEPHTSTMRDMYPKQGLVDETPTAIVTISKKVSPADVAVFKKKLEESGTNATVEQALPKRQNKRNNRNRNRNRSGGTENKAA